MPPLDDDTKDRVRYVTKALSGIDPVDLINVLPMSQVNKIVAAYYDMSIEPKECNEYLKQRIEKHGKLNS